MTNLEHLVENAITLFQKDVGYDEFIKKITSGANADMLPYTRLTGEDLYEIAQYVICTHDM